MKIFVYNPFYRSFKSKKYLFLISNRSFAYLKGNPVFFKQLAAPVHGALFSCLLVLSALTQPCFGSDNQGERSCSEVPMVSTDEVICAVRVLAESEQEDPLFCGTPRQSRPQQPARATTFVLGGFTEDRVDPSRVRVAQSERIVRLFARERVEADDEPVEADYELNDVGRATTVNDILEELWLAESTLTEFKRGVYALYEACKGPISYDKLSRVKTWLLVPDSLNTRLYNSKLTGFFKGSLGIEFVGVQFEFDVPLSVFSEALSLPKPSSRESAAYNDALEEKTKLLFSFFPNVGSSVSKRKIVSYPKSFGETLELQGQQSKNKSFIKTCPCLRFERSANGNVKLQAFLEIFKSLFSMLSTPSQVVEESEVISFRIEKKSLHIGYHGTPADSDGLAPLLVVSLPGLWEHSQPVKRSFQYKKTSPSHDSPKALAKKEILQALKKMAKGDGNDNKQLVVADSPWD